MCVYATDFSVERKPDDSPVSEADRRGEQAIAEHLAAALPDLPVVAEEAVADGAKPEIARTFLLVDPLDGTKEFINRNGEFTVNIAIIEDGAPVAGVVLAPALGLAYAGLAGRAWKGRLPDDMTEVLDWAPIGTRRRPPLPVAVASRSHLTSATEQALSQAGACDRRSIGSSLKFCLLAEGSADFYPRLGPTMEWDTAAGDAVLRAAGGAVVTLDGAPLHYGKIAGPEGPDFRNPYFIAVGDPDLLKGLDLGALKPTKAA